MEAARNAGSETETSGRMRKLVTSYASGERFVAKVLSRELGLDGL